MSLYMSFLIGLAAGAFGGLVGLGGGVVMVPLTVSAFQRVQRQAHGTSLMALLFTAIVGTMTYAAEGSVDYAAGLILAVTAIFTVRAGALYCHVLPEWKLKRAFGFFLVFVSLLLLSKSFFTFPIETPAGWTRVLFLLAIGAVSGFFSGMLGIGGGSIMVTAMVLLVGMTQHMAQGSALLCMIPAGAVGAFTHWRLGNVVKTLLPGLIAGILLGTYFGGTLALYLPENILRIVFASVLTWTGMKYMRAKSSVVP
jgi:uncharacterized membrane protein YfcA